MYRDELEEVTIQITSLKKKLEEPRESQHLRSAMLDRNTLTSSPNHRKKILAQASVSESGVERSSCGTDDLSLKKPSLYKRKLVQKKWTSMHFIKPVKLCPRLEPRQFLRHRYEIYNLNTIVILETFKFILVTTPV